MFYFRHGFCFITLPGYRSRMNYMFRNKLYIENNWGLFFGQLNDNKLHRHYALQISVASESSLLITDATGTENNYMSCWINSNVFHRFYCEKPALILLINPASTIGHHLLNDYGTKEITHLKNDLNDAFHRALNGNLFSPDVFTRFVQWLKDYLQEYQCDFESTIHVTDDRIYKAVQYLEHNFDRVVSLKEIAHFCHLSETRFLHLFKEKTRLNFRRYQLWNRLIKSLPYLKEHSITKTAHHFGFTDSSHYTRTFTETFGLSPKILTSLK